MALKNCNNCGKEFAGDELTMYCSKACKQDAYRKRKKDELSNIGNVKISLAEFEQVLKSEVGPMFQDDFLKFAFLRSRLPEKISFERLCMFLKNTMQDVELIVSSGKEYRGYERFKESFMNGEIQIVETYQVE